MSQSFQLVEEKLRESAFFLDRFRDSDPLGVEARFYFSAFVSAARSVTFVLQKTMRGVSDFDEWYLSAQERLKTDPLARYFKDLRDEVVHKGPIPLNEVTVEHLDEVLRSQLCGYPQAHTIIMPNLTSASSTVLADAVRVSENYLKSLVTVVYECYSRFRCFVDPRWYFTPGHFAAMGKTFEDALSECGVPSSWAIHAPDSNVRWQILRRQQPPCLINDLFHEHLGKYIPDPDDDERQTDTD